MTRIVSALIAIAFVVLLAVIRVPSVAAEQKPLPLPGQGIPRCDIPKEFGRFAAFIPGSDTGLVGQVTAQSANGNELAGQAIFEAQDGTVRWVSVVAPANAGGTGKPALRVMPRNFPVLPIYECALGHLWQRP